METRYAGLDALESRYSVTTERLRRDQYRSLVGFVVGDVAYAVPTACVREITTPSRVTELPHLPQVNNHKIGLCVNRVTGVFEVGFGGLKPVPELGKTVDPRALVGVANQDERLTFVLDIGAFRNYTLDVPLPELPPG
jgi:chemotaxis signal transduction protein